jgi:tyrosyl-tRNA synthetase
MISMDSEERFDLLTRNAEEVVTPEELRKLLETNDRPKGYVGFEPSGLVHLGWVIISNKVRDFVDAGFDFTVFFADWHAYINDKLGGNIDTIRICARYMEDCFEALGVPRDKVNFVYAFELMDNIDYWSKVISIGKNSTLSRVKRAMTIMGREGDEAEVDTSKVMYPLMQAADIFALDVDVAYAGMDQRRAHMLAREAADKLGWKKPVALHTPLLSGLKGGDRMDPLAAKMSKSDPDSGIMIHDSPEDIRRKIKKAFCPPETEGNPILDICRFIIFQRMDVLKIDRPEKFGGPLVFESYQALEESYVAGQLHPMDLKNGTSSALVEMLAPVREFFEEHPENLDRIREILD